MIGILGQLLLVIAFVSSILSGLAYWQAGRAPARPEWIRFGRIAWAVMGGTVLLASVLLLSLLLTHRFEYGYVYQYTSRELGTEFLFSAFWAGQEGSFLLWILMNGVIGLVLTRTARSWESPVMTIVALSQVFLLSMVVGLKLGAFTLGSSPFMSLADKFPDAPIFQQDPNFVPADGNGLNDLLQNYWMVIHPPTLFVGFSTMIVPFAYAVAALWTRRFQEWVRPALPWALFSAMVLGFGITLGGYWAYVTLSFGGYWAWDPVENSSLVPWLISVAGIHTMAVQRKRGMVGRAALFLNITAFLLVIYSTFLTRSGILGDISVHSFVDLGLYNQLLAWILALLFISGYFLVRRYRELPIVDGSSAMLSREFMVFTGAVLLCALGAVVLLGTSAPIMGKFFRDSPSAVPVAFYNKWTLPIAVGFTFLAGLGQLFWWNKMTVERVNRVLLLPIVLAVVSTVLILLFTPFVEQTVPAAPASGSFLAVYGTGMMMLLLVFAAFFAFYGNGIALLRIARGNPRLAGGALAHIGLVLTVFGIVTSSGFNDPLAETPEVDMGAGRDNFVLARGETRTESGYSVTYRGREVNEAGRTAFLIDFKDQSGHQFTLKPVVYKNKQEQWIQHPDLKNYFEKDIYLAVSSNEMFGEAQPSNEIMLNRGDSVRTTDGRFSVRFKDFESHLTAAQMAGETDTSRIRVGALLEVRNLASNEVREVRPLYVIRADGSQESITATIEDWDFAVSFTGMNVDTRQARLAFPGAASRPEDWVVIQAYEKPFINLLWLGVVIMTLGFSVSIARRIGDLQKARKKAVTV